MAGFARMVLVGATVAAGLGVAALRAQTALEDPRNAPRIFANTCSACHKSPQGLAKSGGTASFLRQHYTTGPEMSAAMAAYLASAGNAPASKKNEKQKDGPATAAKETPGQKRTAGHPFTDGSTDVTPRPSTRDKQKTAKGEPKQGSHAAARPHEPPVAPERAPASTTAELATPAPAAGPSEPAAAPAVTLDLPLPQYPSEAPADFIQPPVFSSAPLP